MKPERLRVLISGIERDALNLREAERLQRRRLRGIPDEDVILANVARLYPEKAQAALLRCVKRIHEECPTVRLWILGVGPLENRLRTLCHRLGLQDVTRFLGHIDDLRTCLFLADILVHPSFAEGVPLAVCEGMAVGLPVVASAVGGLPEIVQHGHSGVLIPAAKEPGFEDALVEAVVRLARDPEERACLGRNARHFIENEYSIGTAVCELERVYRELV